MWQKATDGRMNWNDAMSYASGLSLGGHSGWRLPNKDELVGLYNSECKNLMNVRSVRYWSSTTTYNFSGERSGAWHVGFNLGDVLGSDKSSSYYYVCAVRDVQ
jgi:hypothetical protein